MKAIRKGSGLLALLAICVIAVPASAATSRSVTTSVWTVQGRVATAATTLNVLTINDQRRIDNRITAFVDPGGRLALSAPEGLGDPDGAGPSCQLDNAQAGQSTATQVSCAPGYIGAIVGDLGAGNDTFSADPGLAIVVGAVIDGVRRPLLGGPGRDRLVGGLASDLLDGAAGGDSLLGGGGQDILIGGTGADNIRGGAANDVLQGGGGQDRLNGGAGRDLCRGSAGKDRGKSCELSRSIP